MRAKFSFTRQALFLLGAFFVAAFAPGCSCDEANSAPKQRSVSACRAQGPSLPIEKKHASETSAVGTIPVAFNVGDNGQSIVSISLATIPARGVAPDLSISGSSDGTDGVLGVGFSLNAGSAITRCPKTTVLDGEIRAVQYDESDLTSLCLDGKRLVVLSQAGDIIEYRTFPDTQIKVIGHFENHPTSYLEAFLPSGDVIQYGATAATRPMASETNPRAWLATSKRNARGIGIEYGYCFAENDDGSVAEYALDRIDYGTVNGNDPIRSVAFVYGIRDDARLTYSHGLAVQQSLRLDEMQMFGPGEKLVTRYPLSYEQSESTGRMLLQSVKECGADGACKS